MASDVGYVVQSKISGHGLEKSIAQHTIGLTWQEMPELVFDKKNFQTFFVPSVVEDICYYFKKTENAEAFAALMNGTTIAIVSENLHARNPRFNYTPGYTYYFRRISPGSNMIRNTYKETELKKLKEQKFVHVFLDDDITDERLRALPIEQRHVLLGGLFELLDD